MTTVSILRAVLVLVAVAHLFLGAVAFIAKPEMITRYAALTYGAAVTITPPLQHVVRILGAFMLAIGVMAALALRDPVRNRAIVDGIAVLQLLRVAQRFIFSAQIQEPSRWRCCCCARRPPRRPARERRRPPERAGCPSSGRRNCDGRRPRGRRDDLGGLRRAGGAVRTHRRAIGRERG